MLSKAGFMMLHRLFNHARKLIADRSGNFAVLTALLAVPMIGMTGLAVDHYRSSSVQQRIDGAADAAVLTALNTARHLARGNTEWGNLTDAMGQAWEAGMRAFWANLGDTGETKVNVPNFRVERVNNEFVAELSWGGKTPTVFASVFGLSTLNLKGRATAAATLALYTNIHVVMDFSESMLIGATPADQQRSIELGQKLNNGYTCAFLCHIRFASNWNPTYPALKGQVTLRTDVMRSAVLTAIRDLQAVQIVPDQFRMGVYGFSNEIRTFLNPTDARATDLDHVRSVVEAADVWHTSGGGTFFWRLFPFLDKIVPQVGAGITPEQPRQVVILVTDAVSDSQWYETNGRFHVDMSGPKFAPTFQRYELQNVNPAFCNNLKQRGVDIMVVRVRYVIPAQHANMEEFAFIRNTLEPRMENTIGRCATSAEHYTVADTPEEIVRAIQRAFSMVLPVRLTH